MTTEGLSTGKTVLVIAIVMGCFAVLWPKIFYPMMFETPYNEKKSNAHMRPAERPEFSHPGLREHLARQSAEGGRPPMFHGEEGRNFRRTIDKELRPGPMPGMRPSMGGPGIQPQTHKSTSTMGILMPIYSVGIVIFFVYTIMKLVFKNKNEDEAGAKQRKHPLYRSDHYDEQQQYKQQQQQLRARQYQEQQRLAKQQYYQQQRATANHHVDQLPIIPEQRQQEAQGGCDLNCRPDVVQKVQVPEKEQQPSPVKQNGKEKQQDPRDDEIAVLKQRLAEQEKMMQQFMAQVATTMKAVGDPAQASTLTKSKEEPSAQAEMEEDNAEQVKEDTDIPEHNSEQAIEDDKEPTEENEQTNGEEQAIIEQTEQAIEKQDQENEAPVKDGEKERIMEIPDDNYNSSVIPDGGDVVEKSFVRNRRRKRVQKLS